MSCQQVFEEVKEYVRGADNNVLRPRETFFVLLCILVVKVFEGAYPLLSVTADSGTAEPCLHQVSAGL